jgi:hypothetical protein
MSFWSRCLLALVALAPLQAAVPPAAWVPARWSWTDPKTLDLLAGTPINCLLVEQYTAPFVERAGQRGLVLLDVLKPGADPAPPARKAVEAGLAGVVLEGDFASGTAAKVKDALAGTRAVVIEMTTRNRMPLAGSDPVVATYQGLWPGIPVTPDGSTKAGPSGTPWIDTNTGFVRSVRAFGHDAIWLGNRPPENTINTGMRYLQAICDAAIAGARWVVALDHDFTGRLARGDAHALADWKKIGEYLNYFESHPEWRQLQPYGKLAVVQDPDSGALLSGGILDMIAARHTPVRAIPRQKLTPEALAGASMAVNVDATKLTPDEKQVLQTFTRKGGTVLTGPPGWTAPLPAGDSITLEKAELDRINDIWHDVQSMIGRKNLGARLFNVSAMLSNLEATSDGKQVLVHLVNYSSYPIDNVTVHVLGNYKHARFYEPGSAPKDVAVYETEEGTGVDLEEVGVCGTVVLE